MTIFTLTPDVLGIIFSPMYLTPVELTITLQVCKQVHTYALTHAAHPSAACERASADGDIHALGLFIQWTSPYYPLDPQHLAETAAEHGHLHMIMHLDAGYEPLMYDWIARSAADHGHVHLFDWLKQKKVDFGMIFTAENAGYDGYLPVLEWLDDNRYYVADGLDGAVQEGHLHIIKWFASKNIHMSPVHICNAAANCHLDIIEYAHESGYDIPKDTLFHAVIGGYIPMLKYLVGIGIQLYTGVFDIAIYRATNPGIISEKDTFEVLEFLHKWDCPYVMDCADSAESADRVDILRWLDEHQYPLRESALMLLGK